MRPYHQDLSRTVVESIPVEKKDNISLLSFPQSPLLTTANLMQCLLACNFTFSCAIDFHLLQNEISVVFPK